jgi:hypothetical protein
LQEHCQLVKLAIADALEYYPLFSVVAVKGGQGKKDGDMWYMRH